MLPDKVLLNGEGLHVLSVIPTMRLEDGLARFSPLLARQEPRILGPSGEQRGPGRVPQGSGPRSWETRGTAGGGREGMTGRALMRRRARARASQHCARGSFLQRSAVTIFPSLPYSMLSPTGAIWEREQRS